MGAIQTDNAAGSRIRLREIDIGPSDDTPVDVNVALQLKRIKDVSVGGAGTATTVAKTESHVHRDDQSQDAPAVGKHSYTSEPTVYETEVIWQAEINAHGGVQKYWDEDEAPEIGMDALLGLLAAPRTAAAVRLSGTLTYETW